MCQRKLIILNRICLGAREICYEAYSLPKGEVVEITAVQLKKFINNGPDEVYGLTISKGESELEFDESFFTTNLMNKIHTGILTPMIESDSVANIFYVVIGTHKSGKETMYDVISSRFERTAFTAEKVKTLLDLNIITGGAKLESGEIVVAPLEKPKETPKETPKKKEAQTKPTTKTTAMEVA